MSELKWYVVHTHSGCEGKAKLALQERIERNDMSSLIPEVYVPITAIEKLTESGKKKKQERTLYPGYILVKMTYTLETRRLVTGTPRINGFVGSSQHPRPISEQEVLRLTTRGEDGAEGEEQMQVKTFFEKGETVKINEGPFANFNGTVDEVRPDKMKLRVLVSIFGRETPVELDFNQVEKVS